MAEIIYLKDILFIKPDNKSKSEKKQGSSSKSKPTRYKRTLRSSIIEKKKDNNRN